MAMSTHFFNKRDNEAPAARHVVPLPQVGSGNGPAHAQEAGRANPASNPGAGAAAASTHAASPATVNVNPAASAVPPASGSKLTVGPNIKLKGVEITDCDTLLVEGLVEATMDSRLMEIAEQGAFKGSAEIDIAEIRGRFDGDLTVRQKLTVYASGRVCGKIRYGKLVVEEGAQISGDIQFGTQPGVKSVSASSTD